MRRLESALRDFGVPAIVLALAAWIQVELVVHDSAWDAGLAAAALLVPAPLLARRRAPLAAPLLVLVGAVLIATRGPDVAYDVAALFFGVLLATFVAAQHRDPRLALAGLGAALAAVLYVVTRFPDEGASDYVWLAVFVSAIWLAGFVSARRGLEAAAARERARRFEEQARHAAEEERRRIARELHDLVAHSVSVMTVQAGGVRRLLRSDQAREAEALRTIEETGRQALAEMRRMLGMLQERDGAEVPLEPQPGMAELAELIGGIRDAGLPVEYRVKGEPVRLSPGVDVSAYRIVQDALARARDHAGPDGARVEVRWGSGAVELEVSHGGEPDGAGDDLAAMRERVALCGGRLESGRRFGGGYVVRARLPIGEDART